MIRSLNNQSAPQPPSGEHEPGKLFQEYLDKAIAETLFLAKKIQGCKDCELQALYNKPLPGAGYPLANILLLKEAPTTLEDTERVAFFGETGAALRSGFAKLGLDITDVYGTNAIKCSLRVGGLLPGGDPPGSNPLPLKKITEKNILACQKHLETEIEIVQPKTILAMGEISVRVLDKIVPFKDKTLFAPGKIITWRQNITVVMTHDPHEALQNPSLKQEFWTALKFLKELCRK